MSAWLAAAYAMLALGLGWSLTGGARWLRRIPFIVGAPALAVALWLGRPDPAGWPSSGRLPAHADVVSALVREPDPARADRGRIFVWLDVGQSAPRAFELPYSRRLHEQVQRALARLGRHQPVQLAAAAVVAGTHSPRRGKQSIRFTLRSGPELPAKRH